MTDDKPQVPSIVLKDPEEMDDEEADKLAEMLNAQMDKARAEKGLPPLE